jgi:ankyrin repeat protein
VNVPSDKFRSWTALHFAAASESLEIARLVLNADGINRTVLTDDGENCLHLAAQNRQCPGIFRLLLEYPEIDVSQVTHNGFTILQCAVVAKNHDCAVHILNTLQDRLDINALDNKKQSALAIAIRSDQLELGKQFVQMPGIDVHQLIEDQALLAYSILNGFDELSDLLLTHQKNVNFAGPDGVTPLHAAVIRHSRELLARLLKNELIQVNAQTTGGLTALHDAASTLSSEFCRRLIEHPNTKLDIREFLHMRVPLHLCGLRARDLGIQLKWINQYRYSCDAWMPVFRRLAVADPKTLNCQDDSGSSPLHYALASSSFNCGFLRGIEGVDFSLANADGELYLHLAASSGNIAILEIVMRQCPELLNRRTKKQETLLHYAARNGRVDVIRKVLLFDGIEKKPQNVFGVCL